MRKYKATFSNGEVFTRATAGTYKTAICLVNQQTGKCRNVSFSSKDFPSACWQGVLRPTGKFYSPVEISENKKYNATMKELYRPEIVKLVEDV